VVRTRREELADDQGDYQDHEEDGEEIGQDIAPDASLIVLESFMFCSPFNLGRLKN
jgi:hypothetical protein